MPQLFCYLFFGVKKEDPCEERTGFIWDESLADRGGCFLFRLDYFPIPDKVILQRGHLFCRNRRKEGSQIKISEHFAASNVFFFEIF